MMCIHKGKTRDEEHNEVHEASRWSHGQRFRLHRNRVAILYVVVLFVMQPGHQLTVDTSAILSLRLPYDLIYTLLGLTSLSSGPRAQVSTSRVAISAPTAVE
jgi:hypothetical protein